MHRARRSMTVRPNDRRRHGAPLAPDPARAAAPTRGSATSGRLLDAAFRIHNGPAQYLANALGQLRMLEPRIPRHLAETRASLRSSIATTQAALDAAREVIQLLRGAQPDATSGLSESLQAAIEELRLFTDARLSLSIGDLGSLAPALEASLAALGREALANAARHASARHIAVDVRRSGDTVVLEVRDDGRGPNRRRRRTRGGLGLGLIRDQVRLLGGRMTLRSLSSGGTLFRATVPARQATRSGRAASRRSPNRTGHPVAHIAGR